MLSILMWVLILGIIAGVVYKIDMPDLFKTIAYAIIAIILITLLFRAIPSLGL